MEMENAEKNKKQNKREMESSSLVEGMYKCIQIIGRKSAMYTKR